MSTVRFRANGPPSGSLRGSIIQDSDSTLLYWNETSMTWVDGNGGGFVFNDNTVALSEYRSGSYRGNNAFTSTFTGYVIIGVHDSNNSDQAIGEVLAYSRRGRVVNLLVAGDRINRPVAEALIFDMSRRTGGRIGTEKILYISDSDDFTFAICLAELFPENVVVSDITDITVTDSGELTVSSQGPRDQFALFSIDGGQVVGETYSLTSIITMDTGEQVKALLTIQCVSS